MASSGTIEGRVLDPPGATVLETSPTAAGAVSDVDGKREERPPNLKRIKRKKKKIHNTKMYTTVAAAVNSSRTRLTGFE